MYSTMEEDKTLALLEMLTPTSCYSNNFRHFATRIYNILQDSTKNVINNNKKSHTLYKFGSKVIIRSFPVHSPKYEAIDLVNILLIYGAYS